MYPTDALKMADSLLLRKSPERVAPYISNLVYLPTANDHRKRATYCQQALQAQSEGLQRGALGCLGWWRYDGNLPADMWQLLVKTAQTATGNVAAVLAGLGWPYSSNYEDDWEILAGLGRNTANNHLADQLVSNAGDLAEKRPPASAQQVADVLRPATEATELRGWRIFRALDELARFHPGEVFNLFFTRLKVSEQRDTGFRAIPGEISELRFDKLFEDQRAVEQIEELEERHLSKDGANIDESELLLAALLQSDVQREDRLVALVRRTETSDQVECLADLTHVVDGPAMIVTCPQFAKELLLVALKQNRDCHKTVLRILSSGPRSYGVSNGQPDAEWQAHIDSLRAGVEEHADDDALVALYKKALQRNLTSAEEHRKSYERGEAEHDE